MLKKRNDHHHHGQERSSLFLFMSLDNDPNDINININIDPEELLLSTCFFLKRKRTPLFFSLLDETRRRIDEHDRWIQLIHHSKNEREREKTFLLCFRLLVNQCWNVFLHFSLPITTKKKKKKKKSWGEDGSVRWKSPSIS